MSEDEFYKVAVANISRYMDSMKKVSGIRYTVFDGSTALAICFNLPKEKTFEDIMNYREKNIMKLKFNLCPVCNKKMNISLTKGKDYCSNCKKYFKR